MYGGEEINEINLKVTEEKTLNIEMKHNMISPSDITWEMEVLGADTNASQDPIDYVQLTDNKNGSLTIKAKKVGYLRLSGKVSGYKNMDLYISNLYTTGEETLTWINKLNGLEEAEIQALTVIHEDMGTSAQIEEVRTKAREITEGCSTNREKIYAIEQWLANHVAYDYEYLEYYEYGTSPIKTPPLSAYDILYNRFTVCGGYAEIAEVMLRSIGIPCVYIVGLAGGAPDNKSSDHAWNAAYDGETWIYFDATWDSSSTWWNAHISSGEAGEVYFDFDPVKMLEERGRYISSMDLEQGGYSWGRYVNKNYITLFEGQSGQIEFLEGIGNVSLTAKGDYLEMDYDFYPYEKRQMNKEFISVDQNGRITALKEGMGVIEIEGNQDPYYDYVYVRVLKKRDFAFKQSEYKLALGNNVALECIWNGENVTRLVKLTSSDTNVVKVDEKGNLIPVSLGTAKITGHFYCNEELTISCDVVVSQTVEIEEKIEFKKDFLVYEVLTQPEGNTAGTVAVIGEQFNYGESSNEISVTIPETVVYEGNTYKITVIGENAFSELIGQASISIPASVERIEKKAFYPAPVGTDLKGELTFPEGSQLRYIGEYAFAENEKLTKVDLSNCTKLEVIDDYAFSECSYITMAPNGETTEVGITEVIFPERLQEIGKYAFQLSQILTTVQMPKEVEYIGDKAFANTNIDGIMDLSGVKSVGEGIFYEVYTLKGIVLPDDWTEIPDKMFSNTNVPWVASESCLEEAGGIENMESGNILLSENIVHIGEAAFSGNGNIRKVQAAEVKSIGKKAFFYCDGLVDLDFEENLSEIPEKAFMNCNNLKEFTMGENVTKIGYAAFYGCKELTDMRIPSEKIEVFEQRSFPKGITFYIPKSKAEVYMKELETYATDFYDLDGNLLDMDIPNDPDNPNEPETDGEVTGIKVEFKPQGGLQYPKAGHIVVKDDLIVSKIVKTADGEKLSETSDYIIYDETLKRGNNDVTIAAFDSFGNIFEQIITINAEVKLESFEVKLKDSVKLKAGDTVKTSQFTATALYSGENNYSEQVDIKDFEIIGNAVLEEGSNTITFSYTETTQAYGTITKTVEWNMCTDDKPVLSTNVININQNAVETVSFEVYIPFGLNIQLDGIFYQNNKGKVQEGISYTANENKICTIQIPQIMKNKTYSLYVKAYVKETQKDYYLPLKLVLKTTLPKITASAEKLNLFYTDEESRICNLTLKNQGEEIIQAVQFEENSTMDPFFDIIFDKENQAIALKLTKSGISKKELVNKGKLCVWLENYNTPVTVSVNISVSDQKPKLKITPASVNINTRMSDCKEAFFDVTMQDGKVYVPVVLEGTNPEIVSGKEFFEQIRVKDNRITLQLKNTSDFQKVKTIKIKLQAGNWKNPIELPYKIKTVNVLPKAILGMKTLSLDQRAVGANVVTTLTFDTVPGDITYKDLPEVLLAVKNEETAPKVTLEKIDDRTYQVRASYRDTMKKGTYKYELMPELSDGTMLNKVTLSVKVTTANKAAGASLKVQKGGKIELINRSTTKYEYVVTPTVKETFIKEIALKKVELGKETVDKSLFDVKVNREDGVVTTIEVSASENGDFSAGKKYKLTFEVIPATQTGALAASETYVNISLKESSLQLNANIKTATLYRNIPYVKAIYKVTPKMKGAEIEKMEYVASKGVPEGAFKMTQTETGTWTISIADKTKVAAKKSYKLSFKVQAKGGKKTVTQSVTIKVQ